MTRKRVYGLSIALFVFLIIFFAAGSFTSQAQGQSGLTVGLRVNPDGTWQVINLFGQEVELAPQRFNDMAQALGLQFAVPAQLVPPEMLAPIEQADIAQVTLALEGEAARIWVNDGQSLPSVKVYPQNLQSLVGEPFRESYGILTGFLRSLNATVYLRFAPGELAQPELTEVAAAPATEGEIPNFVSVGATLSPQGEVLSAAGFTHEELAPLLDAAGLTIPPVDATVAATLAQFDQLAVDISPSKLVLLTNDQAVAEVVWNADSRMRLLETVESFVPGFSTRNPQIAPIVDLAESWLQTSRMDVALHIAERPQEQLPVVELGEPIVVAFDEAGTPSVAGMSIAGVDPRAISPVVGTFETAGIDQAQLCWQGTEVRWLVNGMQMPYVAADPGWLTETIRLLGWQPLPLVDKLEQFLAELQVPLAVLVDPAASAPDGGCGAYQVAEAGAPAMAFAVEGTWDRAQNELALDEVDLPYGMLGMLPLDIRAQVGFPKVVGVFVPATVDSVEASVGSNGVSAKVDDVDVAVRWDAGLLSNLAEVADNFGFGPVVRQVAQVISVASVSLGIDSVEPLAEVPAEEVTAAVAEAPAEIAEAEEQSAPASEAQTETEAEAAPEAAEQTETQAAPAEEGQPEAAARPDVCVVPKGGNLWDCWVAFGRSEGTGMVWQEWRDAMVEKYNLTERPVDDLVIVLPGAEIAKRPGQ